jgi:hypothetical protein
VRIPRRDHPEDSLGVVVPAPVIGSREVVSALGVEDCAAVQQDHMRSAQPAVLGGRIQDVRGVCRRVVTEREKVIEPQQLIAVVQQLTGVGRAVREAHAPLRERGGPGARILRVDATDEVLRVAAGEHRERGRDALFGSLWPGGQAAVTEEAVGVVGPERRVAVMGHGGAEDTLFLAECKRVLLRIAYE